MRKGFFIHIIVLGKLEKGRRMDSGHQDDEAIQDNLNELAAAAIHNISNIINSTVVCVNSIRELTESFTIEHYVAAVEKLTVSLSQYPLTEQEKLLLKYFESLGQYFQGSRVKAFQEIEQLDKHIDHIKHIVQAQLGLIKDQSVFDADLNQLLEDALCLCGFIARGKNDILVEKNFSSLPTISADKHKFIQIFTNLIKNSQFSLYQSKIRDKKISISTAVESHNIKIKIQDNGIGVSKENLTKIFDRGFTTRSDGHGIGLYSVAKSIEEMGGSLQAESEGFNTGAVFTINLPIKSKLKL